MRVLSGTYVDYHFEPFFKWIPADEYLKTDDPENTEMSVMGIVKVDKALRQEYATTVDPHDPLPEDGIYITILDGDGRIFAFQYNDLATAERDFEGA